MSFSIRSVTIDCRDPYRLARWWCKAVRADPSPDDHPGDPEASCPLGEGLPRLLFERVPEPKSEKNRVHVDFLATDRGDAEIDRLVSLGARLIEDRRRDDGGGWVILSDPEGNEFCMERSISTRPRS